MLGDLSTQLSAFPCLGYTTSCGVFSLRPVTCVKISRGHGLTFEKDWNSAVLILRYWVSDSTVPSYAWALIFWVVFSVITLLGVGVYGELEYYFGMFKFLSLIILFILSIVANVGGFGGDYIGFRYWTKPDGCFLPRCLVPSGPLTLPGPIIHGINGFGQVFVLAAAYYVGTEIISLAGGEARNPKRDIPRVRLFFSGVSVSRHLEANSSSVFPLEHQLCRLPDPGRIHRHAILPRPHLPFLFPPSAQRRFRRGFLPIHHRLRSRGLEVGWTFCQRSDPRRIRLCGEWRCLCAVPYRILSGTVQPGPQDLRQDHISRR